MEFRTFDFNRFLNYQKCNRYGNKGEEQLSKLCSSMGIPEGLIKTETMLNYRNHMENHVEITCPNM